MTKQEREKRAWRTWSCIHINKSEREKNHMYSMLWRAPTLEGLPTDTGYAKRCVIIGLNPSVWCPVDHIPKGCKMSPTMRNAIAIAMRAECDELVMVNLFTWCTLNPSLLRMLHLGDEMLDEHCARLIKICAKAKRVVCAWGMHGRINRRGMRVRQQLRCVGIDLSCIGYCTNGQPYHVLAWQRVTQKVRLQYFKMRVE